MKLQSRL